MKQVHTIDAQGKRVGRIASEAASILRGKKSPDYVPHKVADLNVHIVNTQHLKIDESKLKDKQYTRYSGHPGGLKYESMENVIEKKGYPEIVRKAVYGMLPNNKLRSKLMKNLIVTE